MAKCKHTRLPDRIKSGGLPHDEKQYYCTQCQKWVPAGPVNAEVDRRLKDEIEIMQRYKKMGRVYDE